jgi:pimeloyl-ACP methyl ester carboxylesterase
VKRRTFLKLTAAAVTADLMPDSPVCLAAPASNVNDRESIERELKELASELERIRKSAKGVDRYLLADAEIFHKGIVWALRYETNLTIADLALLRKSLNRGLQRATALRREQPRWTGRKGKVLRGFRSEVDGSTQPYGLIIPKGYDGTKPMRLDVVLHGSSKPVGLSELRFGARFDEGDEPLSESTVPDNDYIELHPLGRVENCYRWAGETDVFEAIEAVCRNYQIDRDRIVLRGMSMGASGTWHIGLKYPDRFVAIGPYCGYVDTHRFSETPMPNFIRVGPLPPYQEKMLHMLDSVDYAANAGVVPEIAAIGDKDVFFQGHVQMGEAMAREGLKMVNLISPGTGHVIDPVTHAEQMRRIGEYAAKGLDHAPRKLRFVTWTLKYNRCHWLEVLALKQHYERAAINASVSDDGSVEIEEPRNITKFAIHPPMLTDSSAKLYVGGIEVVLPARGSELVLAQRDGKWRCLDSRDETKSTGKRPGLQGPIDDAFTTPFVCVRGTSQAWNPAVGAWADSSLRRFAYEWARYLRGELPVVDDNKLSPRHVETKNLILFGDPGSNSWIRQALPSLPISWTKEHLELAGIQRSARDHAPALICASPFPGAEKRYLVLNSGHTFHEKEFAAFNYLLFPRLGDWAVIKAGAGAEGWQPSSPEFLEQVVRSGFFNEKWK